MEYYPCYYAIDKIQVLQLKEDHIITAEDVGVRKPNPRGFAKLMTISGLFDSKTLLIGGRIERDGYAARRAVTHVLILSKNNKRMEYISSIQRSNLCPYI